MSAFPVASAYVTEQIGSYSHIHRCVSLVSRALHDKKHAQETRARQNDVTTPREPASRLLRVSCFQLLDVDRHFYDFYDWALTDFGPC